MRLSSTSLCSSGFGSLAQANSPLGATLTPFISAVILMATATAAFADATNAFNIPDNLRSDPKVVRMMKEYNTIAANDPTCADKRYFGLRVVKVDGLPQVRYYVDGKGLECIPARMQPSEAWHITRPSWTRQDEDNWSEFISSLGQAVESGQCSTVDSCLISQANILRQPNDVLAFHFADCAEFPMVLRTYFSFRSSLPFSFSSDPEARALTAADETVNAKIQKVIDGLLQKQNSSVGLSPDDLSTLNKAKKTLSLRGDSRYTPNGNWIANREWILKDNQTDYYRAVAYVRQSVSTANYRVWRNQGESGLDSQGRPAKELEPDFYSPRLDPIGIKPGTVLYKPDGHAGIVYRVDTQTGQIFYMDSHPDNSLTHGVVDATWTNEFASRPNDGGGFKNFRPMITEKAWFFAEPTTRMETDAELGSLFSSEQYDKFSAAGAKVNVSLGGKQGQVDFSDFLRIRMSNGTYRVDPIAQFKADSLALCQNIQFRHDDVAAATEKSIHLIQHPAVLPDNIYGASGDWETYSTPGRDVTFKSRVLNLTASLVKYRDMIKAKHILMTPGMTVELLKSEAASAWNDIASSCEITYINSRGNNVSFDLNDALLRAPLMSFDPYVCPEHRFGATKASELATCTDDAEKNDWYSYEQFLRNRVDKNDLEVMGWSLTQLKRIPNASTVNPTLVKRLDVLGAINGL